MSTKLLTGHQSVNHIAAPDDAAVNAALITGENCIIANGKTLAPSIDPATGEVTVGAFVALFSGRKVVSTGDMVTYTTPASASLHRHVSVGILYERDTNDDDVETCTLAVFTSETDRTTESAAEQDDTGAEEYQTSITAATTTAYMELFNFVCTASSVKTSADARKTYKAFSSDAAQRTNTDDRLTTLETWKSSKNTSDAAVANRVTQLETNYSFVRKLTKTSQGYYTQENLLLIIVKKADESRFTSIIAARYGTTNGQLSTSMSYDCAGGGTCHVTFTENNNYASVYVIDSYGSVYAVYEIKAV